MSEQRIVIKVGPDKYDVIEGVKLNDKPLDRAAADALARARAVPPPPARKVWRHVPSGEVWIEPQPLNSPVRARPGWLTRHLAAKANAAPIPFAALGVDRWASRGGSAGFSCDGLLLGGKKPQ